MALVGKPCPRFSAGTLHFLKGEPTDVPAPGRPTVVELWATWCGPCRQMFPHLSQIARAHAPQGLVVVGVSLEPASPQLQAFVQQQGRNMEYAVAASEAAGQSLMTAAGVSGIPCALVVDRKGIVRFCGHPADPGFESSVRTVCTERAGPAPETRSRAELVAAPIRELKALLAEHGVSAAGAAEKGDLVDLVATRCR